MHACMHNYMYSVHATSNQYDILMFTKYELMYVRLEMT